MGAVGGVVGGVAGPAAPIVLPIMAAGLLVKWAYDVYRQTPGIVRLLMGYIIDMNAMLECLFVLGHCRRGPNARPITQALIDLTFTTYNGSESRAQNHREIYTFVEKEHSIFQRDQCDQVSRLE